MQEFRSVSIAMVTYQTIDELTKYIVRKNLNMYPNIYAGTEGNVFFLRKYYGITTFPYVALYTKEGNLVYKDYGTRVTVDGVAKKIKGL